MIIASTYNVNIYMGLRESYDGIIHSIQEVMDVCQKYCDKVGLGLTITPTTFCYTNGNEPGVIIGLINYPRFPQSNTIIREHAFGIAKLLKDKLKQERCSVVTPHITYMLGEK